MAGYAYEAGGQGVALCDSGQASILHVFQNVFLGMNPDRALKVFPCGFDQPAPLVYERLGPADGTGLNFFLEPTPSGVYLKSVVLDDSTPFDVGAVEIWGAFHQPPDSLAASPRGRIVVGINRQLNKLEVLHLGQNPVDISRRPEWVVFANQYMGTGTRPGLPVRWLMVSSVSAHRSPSCP
jgi:hypothetical protein